MNLNINSLRIKNELKNAELDAEIARIVMENRAKAAKNTISMHITEAKINLKASKGLLKPSGMNIAECVENATALMSQIPLDSLHQCLSSALTPITKRIAELKMLEAQAAHIMLYCHINMLEITSCVDERIDAIKARVNEIRQSIREDVENLRRNTCIGEAEKKIFEQLSEILGDGFADCVQNELVDEEA